MLKEIKIELTNKCARNCKHCSSNATNSIDNLKDTVECPYCGTSYSVSELIGESDAVRIEKIKSNTQKEIEKEKLKNENAKLVCLSACENDENLAKTTELVHVTSQLGLSLEAEVGSIGGEEDGVIGQGECADPMECKTIADLGVSMLAAGIGNIHGKYPENWAGLSFETLDAIQAQTGDMPLVLHGGTGIPADQVKKAISLGVAKVNVNTECQLGFQAEVRKYIEAGKDLEGKGFDPRKLLAPGVAGIKAVVVEKMELFGSVGKAE